MVRKPMYQTTMYIDISTPHPNRHLDGHPVGNSFGSCTGGLRSPLFQDARLLKGSPSPVTPTLCPALHYAAEGLATSERAMWRRKSLDSFKSFSTRSGDPWPVDR